MIKLRALIACTLIIATWCAVNLFERPKYISPEIIPNLNIPATLPDWRSRDFSSELKLQADDRYNFISDAFARVYANREGDNLLFLLLDAGNFHHPKVCFESSGFEVMPIEDTDLGPVKARTLFVRRDTEAFVVIYWMVIDGKHVDWTEQKWKQLWYSLFGKQRAGIMGRIDVPVAVNDEMAGKATARTFITDILGLIPESTEQTLFGN